MSSLDSKGRYPRDIGADYAILFFSIANRRTVAIFHASFHPTQGNIIDWSLKANEGEQPNAGPVRDNRESDCKKPDLNLDNLEFSALPSGLHLVEEDVVCVLVCFPFNRDCWFRVGAWLLIRNCTSNISVLSANCACSGARSGDTRATDVACARAYGVDVAWGAVSVLFGTTGLLTAASESP
jgi:hypothetical protein